MSLIGVIPEELFDPSKKAEIIALLNSLDIHHLKKKQLLAGWKQATGARLSKEDYFEVQFGNRTIPTDEIG